jgi:ABC-2 type transport system permease protein
VTGAGVRVLRIIWSGFRMNLKMLGTSGFFLLTSVFQPMIFATVAYYMFRSGGRAGTLLSASLGEGMMGVWSTTLFGSGGMIQWQRWQGTLELGVASPPTMGLLYLPFSLANAFTGMYALAATLVWGRLVFGVPLHFQHPWLFALSLPATVISLGLMGLVLASTFVLYRYANALANLLEYPVWIASGLVFSTSILPAWTRPISWILPPYWGILAIRHAALGGAVWGPLGMVVVLGAAYALTSFFTFRVFEDQARARATLSLT